MIKNHTYHYTFQVRLIQLKQSQIILEKCRMAESFLSRFLGLMGKTSLSSSEALWIPRCSSIHMWWMRISLDVLFLKKFAGDKSIGKNIEDHDVCYEVIKSYSNLKPWKLFPVSALKATDVLEMSAGLIKQYQIREGDKICIIA